MAKKELDIICKAVDEILAITVSAFTCDDNEMAKAIEPLEETIDMMVKKCKNHHIQRGLGGECPVELGFIFNDCLHNMERVADHCSNLAVTVLESTISTVHAHDYLRSIKESGDNQYQILLAGYASKYHID